jgi:hypothetical protein
MRSPTFLVFTDLTLDDPDANPDDSELRARLSTVIDDIHITLTRAMASAQPSTELEPIHPPHPVKYLNTHRGTFLATHSFSINNNNNNTNSVVVVLALSHSLTGAEKSELEEMAQFVLKRGAKSALVTTDTEVVAEVRRLCGVKVGGWGIAARALAGAAVGAVFGVAGVCGGAIIGALYGRRSGWHAVEWAEKKNE